MKGINLITEASALGAALLDAAQANELVEQGNVELFTTNSHRAIFEAISDMDLRALDYSTLADELHRRGQFDQVGWDVLLHLDDGVVLAVPMRSRLYRLWELWKLRRLARLGEELAEQCEAPGVESPAIIAMMTRRISEIASR